MQPWKILESTYIRPRIRIDKCALPNGGTLDALTMEFREWANVVAFTKDGKIVLVRQYRHGPKADSLEFPGGVIEDGEDPLTGALRELREETGYTAAQIISTGVLYPNPALQTNRLHCYLAFDAEKVADQQLDHSEEIEVELVSLEEMLALCREGKFLHALNVAVFFQALLHLQRVT